MPTDNTDYNCDIKVVELVQPIVWCLKVGGVDTYTHKYTHTDF